MPGLTTHVLDLATGRPAQGVTVSLARQGDSGWVEMSERVTDADGRVRDFLGDGKSLEAGRYRLVFATGEYLRARGGAAFHPEIPVIFEVRDPTQHCHVPLLLSPFGYTTYRGS